MRQNSIRCAATFTRIVCAVLFALGIALVDLSVVWAHTPTSPPSWHSSGSLSPETDVTMLPDGRAAAFVVISEPLLPPGGAETMLFVFANEDGAWLLDDLIDFTIVSLNSGA
jgi:hypothetical protein